METCYGCGAKADQHPVVGVLNAKDLKRGTKAVENPVSGQAAPDGQKYEGVPVCDACHRDPAHRSQNALKCHFFMRDNARLGLVMAGSPNLGG